MTEPLGARRWTPRAAASRAVAVARQQGAGALWFKTWGEMGYRRMAWFELPPDAPVPAPTVALTVAHLTEADHAEYAALRPGADLAAIEPRYDAGHRCYVARLDGGLVCSCWVARGRLWSARLGLHVDLAPDEAATYELYVARDRRRRGVALSTRAWIIEDLRRAGVRRLVSLVDPENEEGFRLVRSLGYRRVGTVRAFAGRRIGRRVSRSRAT